MKPIEDFLPWVARSVPGAPDPVIESAILESAIRFCEQAYVWQSSGFKQDIKAGITEYFIQQPVDGQIQKINVVYVDGREIQVLPENEIPVDDSVGTPWAAYVTDANRLVVYPAPDKDFVRGLIVKAYCRPTENAKKLPDILFGRYRKAIEHGALAVLKGIPMQRWTNESHVAYHEREFRKSISMARGDRIDGRATGGMTVRRRRFC